MRFDSKKAAILFGDTRAGELAILFSRRNLSERDRLLCVIACLQALGDSSSLTAVLKLALEDRADFGVAYEVLLQGYLFCGYPRAIESFFCLSEALSGGSTPDSGAVLVRPFVSSDELLKQGRETHKLVHGRNSERMQNKISALCPDLGYLMVAEGYGRILSRKELGIGPRELAVVSSISALGSVRQLNSHIRGCRNVGCSDYEIYESIYCGRLWLPAERLRDSLDVWSEITGLAVFDKIDK